LKYITRSAQKSLLPFENIWLQCKSWAKRKPSHQPSLGVTGPPMHPGLSMPSDYTRLPKCLTVFMPWSVCFKKSATKLAACCIFL
jgi:hypothetical protein